MEERARLLVNQLLLLSDAAQRSGEGWPDLCATNELRTVLLEVVESAEAHARRWNALARQLEALAVEGAHMHLEDGVAVAATGDHFAEADAAPLPL
jgi:thioesterase domain-containing protein